MQVGLTTWSVLSLVLDWGHPQLRFILLLMRSLLALTEWDHATGQKVKAFQHALSYFQANQIVLDPRIFQGRKPRNTCILQTALHAIRGT